MGKQLRYRGGKKIPRVLDDRIRELLDAVGFVSPDMLEEVSQKHRAAALAAFLRAHRSDGAVLPAGSSLVRPLADLPDAAPHTVTVTAASGPARIYIDGTPIGMSPLETPVPAGRTHTIWAELDGNKIWEESFQAEPHGQTTISREVPREPPTTVIPIATRFDVDSTDGEPDEAVATVSGAPAANASGETTGHQPTQAPKIPTKYKPSKTRVASQTVTATEPTRAWSGSLRWVLLACAVVVVVVAAVAIAPALLPESPPVDTSHQAAELKAQGETALEARRYDNAEEYFRKALAANSGDPELQALIDEAKRRQQEQAAYEEGVKAYRGLDWTLAKSRLSTIPPDSPFYERSERRLAKIKNSLASSYRAGKSLAAKHLFSQAAVRFAWVVRRCPGYRNANVRLDAAKRAARSQRLAAARRRRAKSSAEGTSPGTQSGGQSGSGSSTSSSGSSGSSHGDTGNGSKEKYGER